MNKITLTFLLLLTTLEQTMAQTAVTIDTKTRLQTVEGWGVSLCWWAAQAGKWTEEQQDEVVDWLVSPDGLNYNVFRYNIPGGDAPGHDHMSIANKGKGLRTKMNAFLASEPSTNDWSNSYDWAADEPQISILRKIIAKYKQYHNNELPIIEAFANTPPYWMTVSGCASGAKVASDTNLKREYYGKFAKYLIDVCKHFKESEGIVFHSLEPFNEPKTNYWRENGDQEGCGFKANDQVDFVKNHLAPALAKSGLSTIISVSDETNEKLSKEAWDVYTADKEVMRDFVQWNTHSYSYDASGNKDRQARRNARNINRATLRDAVAEKGKKLWMSETGHGSFGIGGNLILTEILFDDIRYLQPAVWCDWQVIDNGNQWSTITCAGSDDCYIPPYSRNKNYYVRQQVTKHIKIGYTFVKTNSDQVIAAVSPDNKELVVCILNSSKNDIDYDLSNVRKWKKCKVSSATFTDRHNNASPITFDNIGKVTAKAQSVTTIILL